MWYKDWLFLYEYLIDPALLVAKTSLSPTELSLQFIKNYVDLC